MTAQALLEILAADTVESARTLVGHLLVRRGPGDLVRAGRIVETEAYTFDDPASHSYRGTTARNRSMFSTPGTAYVYLIYGIHCCLNVVTGVEGRGEAVLIRAVEPVEGIEAMQEARAAARAGRGTGSAALNGAAADARKTTWLCSGPGKVCQAFTIDRSFDGADLFAGERQAPADGTRPHAQLEILPERFKARGDITTAARIGIRKSADLPRRFFCAESPHVSRRG